MGIAVSVFVVTVLDVTAVAGHKAKLPCDIGRPQRNDLVVMILWYRESMSRQPIFSVDARRGGLHAGARNWSDPKAFGGRASMRIDTSPALLEIDPLMSTDGGVYKCRVDFRDSPTKNQKINLTVIGEKSLIINDFFSFSQMSFNT